MRQEDTFGTLLRRYRLAESLTQEKLAELAGISVNAIAALERGRRTAPRPDTVTLIVEALRLDPPDRAAMVSAANAARSSPTAPPGPGAPFGPPPSRLPIAPTPLLGRQREEAALAQHLEGGKRLVTLQGPGGVGKTRLALQVAQQVEGSFTDGAIFVDLSPIHDALLAASTIAQALGGHETGLGGPRDLVASLVGDRHILLVLDNLEQITDISLLITGVLEACPQVAVLATSRIALHVRAEYQFPLAPLPLPPSHWSSQDDLLGYPSIQLFLARAQPEIDLTADNEQAVAEICRRLDGLPLAIELAAARTRLLPPRALADRLRRPLATLTRGPQDLPARQQTLRATLEWSYDLLHPTEQVLFMRLGVFTGGFTVGAVEGVCDPDGDLYVLDALDSLLDSSLLRELERLGESRLGMLETVREYAAERLADSDEAEQVRRWHALYFLSTAEASLEWFRAQQKTWLDNWEREHDNLRAALEWALASGEVEIGLRLAGAIWRFWRMRSHYTEGRSWLQRLLEAPATVSLGVRGLALHGLAALTSEHGDAPTAAIWAERGLVVYREIGDDLGVADMLNLLGNTVREQGDYQRATEHYQESMALYRRFDDAIGVSAVLSNLGTTARYQGDLAKAAALLEESLVLRRASGEPHGIAYVLNNLAELAVDQGDHALATAYYQETLALRRELGDRQGMARTLLGLGRLAVRAGQTTRAAEAYREALTLSLSADDEERAALSITGLAEAALHSGEPRYAARLLAWIEVWDSWVGGATFPHALAEYERVLASARASLSAEAFAAAWREGATMSLEQLTAALPLALTAP